MLRHLQKSPFGLYDSEIAQLLEEVFDTNWSDIEIDDSGIVTDSIKKKIKFHIVKVQFSPSISTAMMSTSSSSDEESISTGVRKQFEYFNKYLNEDFFSNMAEKTNMKPVSSHGKSLNTTPDEINKYWAANIVISLLGFPKLRMCCEQCTRYPMVAENISRDHFYCLIASLKVVVDNAVSDNVKTTDRYWKIRPMLTMIRKACLQHPCPKMVSIDEQMVPFHGQVCMK
ncbi:uncharacterized protein LOC124799040 [Schistocerca piceifrons]|uniref:uncharacterized protein LOC124799040 n=1 Tax=Schistocerca piceifrons TaxID=274613 RepID=UPI001F5E760F|nr:uncharacterized protein LOC124799040 [Schistocerca piceifrons]